METLPLVLKTLQVGVPVLLGHISLAILIWIASIFLTCFATPNHEIRGLRMGGMASSITTGGSALALSIPIGTSLSGAINAWDLLLWSIPVILLQMSAYWLTQIIIPDLTNRLDAEDLAAAIFLLLFRLGFSLINAAAIAI